MAQRGWQLKKQEPGSQISDSNKMQAKFNNVQVFNSESHNQAANNGSVFDSNHKN